MYDDHLAQPAAHPLKQLVDEHQPNLILFGLTYPSRDVAGRLQALSGSTLMSNATDLTERRRRSSAARRSWTSSSAAPIRSS